MLTPILACSTREPYRSPTREPYTREPYRDYTREPYRSPAREPYSREPYRDYKGALFGKSFYSTRDPYRNTNI
jgi:hypothetical protein